MKAFMASLVVFAVLIVASLAHVFFVSRVAACLSTFETAFPCKEADKNSPDPILQRTEEYWLIMRNRLSYTVNARYLNAISTALCNVIDYYTCGSVSDYEASRSLFREAVANLRLADSISLAGLI